MIKLAVRFEHRSSKIRINQAADPTPVPETVLYLPRNSCLQLMAIVPFGKG
jgi:hypothetical protein